MLVLLFDEANVDTVDPLRLVLLWLLLLLLLLLLCRLECRHGPNINGMENQDITAKTDEPWLDNID